MTTDAAPGWYVFRTLPRQDGVAEINLARQGFRAFVPRIIVTKRHAGKFETKREPLFPRYAFVALDVGIHRWRAVNGTFGVESLVMTRDRPAKAPSEIVEGLLSCADQYGVVDLTRGLKVGSKVRIIAGPFSGTLGTLQRLDGKGRVELLLELINGVVRVHVANDMLEAI